MRERFGQVDVLVNNAGGGFLAEFVDVNAKGQDALVRENFGSVTNFVRAFVPLMPPDGGSIINLTSVEAHRAAPGFAIYSAQKAAVTSLSKSLALELGARRIRVNCIAPDVIPTPGVGPLSGETGPVPLGITGHVDDVAAAAVYLAGPTARFVTGTTIHVDGGTRGSGRMAAARGRELGDVRFGVALGRLNPVFFTEITAEAERLGFESVWLPEHLVFPVEMGGSPFPGEEHPPVPPSTPVFDAFAYLSFLAGRTSSRPARHPRLQPRLRHPFVAARAVQTLDIVSGGRAEIGIGAGWLESEWHAAGLDFASRGRRLDEALAVCKRLWTEEVVEHHGEFFDFDPVMFEPKPVQKPCPPVLVGGESAAALRRTAHFADGWVGLDHTPESVVEPIKRLAELRGDAPPLEITVGADVCSPEDVARFEEAGVQRLLVSPWARSRQALDGLRRFADTVALPNE